VRAIKANDPEAIAIDRALHEASYTAADADPSHAFRAATKAIRSKAQEEPREVRLVLVLLNTLA